jgi:hypothetical protein
MQRGRLPNVTSLCPSVGSLPQVQNVVNQLARLGGWKVGGMATKNNSSQGVLGVPQDQDPFAPRRGPLESSPDRERAIEKCARASARTFGSTYFPL